MRAVMRSTSAQLFSAGVMCRAAASDALGQYADGVASRAQHAARSRSGWCSQWCSRRLPMLVAEVSSSESRVGAGFAAQGLGDFQIAPGGGIERT